MASKALTQTAAVIRYLLALNELDRDDAGVRSIDLAERLKVTKPSVHTMLKTLEKKRFVIKEKYEAVHLTEEGREIAGQYAACFELLYCKMLCSLKIPEEDCCKVVCATLSEMTAEDILKLTERLKRSSCRDCILRNEENKYDKDHA